MGATTWVIKRRREAEAAAIASAPIASDRPSARRTALEAMHWSKLRDLCEQHGLPDKPDDRSWANYAIPLILKAEGY
jgi:hypothetical protein